MSNPESIISLLQATLMGSTQSIREAEKSLKNLHQDPSFLINLLMISLETSVPYNIQKAAIVHTMNVARGFIETKNFEMLNSMAQTLVNFMNEKQIQITLMKYLSLTVETILTFDKGFGIRKSFQSTFIQALQGAMNQSDANLNYAFLGLCAQISMGSTLHITKQFNEFLKSTLMNFVQLNLRALTHVRGVTQTNNRQQIMHSFRILKIYSYALKLYFKKVVYADLHVIKLLYDEAVSNLLFLALELSVGNNELSSNFIFYQRNQDNGLIELLHSIKADYVTSIAYLSRAIMHNFKENNMILSNRMLGNQNLIPAIINIIKELFQKCPYHKIKSRATIKLIEEYYNVLIICVRNSLFFQIFLKEKQNVLNGCIFNTLLFSPTDYENYFYEPDEFINEVIQIIEMDPNEYLQNRKKQTGIDSEGYQEIQNYSTLRTVASTLLNNYTKHIDGTLPEIVQFSMKILKTPSVKSEIPLSLILLLLGILRDQIGKRQNQIEQISLTLMNVLYSSQLPKTGEKSLQQLSHEEQEKSIEFIMLLIILYKYLPKTSGIQNKVVPAISQVINTILNQKTCSDGLKYICFDLVTVVSTLDTQKNKQVTVAFVKLMNLLLINQYRHAQKILEIMFYLYKYKDAQISEFPQLLVGTVQHLSQIIYKQVELNQQSITKLNINKSWNIISDISQNQLFIPRYINQIQNAVMPLLGFIDGKRELDYEENIFMMMTSFIRKSKTVTQNELVMFEIIPKLFYTQYKRLFGHSFETLHIFILYGSNILASAPQAMNVIIDMCICSMETISLQISQHQTRTYNEGQNCEGVLILHSLMLSCGNYFTNQMWMKVAKAFTNRLENPPATTKILRANIIAGISILVMVGHMNFSADDNNVLLNNVLQLYSSCTVKYPAKAIIVSLSEMLGQPTLLFVQNRITFILDTITSLLEMESSDSHQFLIKGKEDYEKDYEIIESQMENKIVEMDHLQFFKNKIKDIKQNYPQVLHQCFAELSESKKKFIRDLMTSQNIVGEQRKIFKIAKS